MTETDNKPTYKEIRLLDKGYVKLVDHMGSDQSIVAAARVSYEKGTKTVRDDASLIDYLIRNYHTSPLEMVEFVFEMKLPLFVARQMVRHRTASLNEVSARYSVLEDEFYIPDTSRMNPQSGTNKQGSENVVLEGAERLVGTIEEVSHNAYKTYEGLLEDGLSRELARMVLPTNIYTKWVWKCDLNNLLKFLTLRADAHAQYEIRVYADAMLELIEPFVPSVIASYKNHFLNKTTFSKDEMDLLMEYLLQLNIEVPETWSATKKREFLKKVTNG